MRRHRLGTARTREELNHLYRLQDLGRDHGAGAGTRLQPRVENTPESRCGLFDDFRVGASRTANGNNSLQGREGLINARGGGRIAPERVHGRTSFGELLV